MLQYVDQELLSKYGHMLGKVVGYGISRLVVRSKDDSSTVLKIPFTMKDKALDIGAASNRREVEVWNEIKDSPAAVWFCPVLWHTDDFEIIAMPLVDVAGLTESHVVPQFFQAHYDFHVGNFGLLDGRVVCVDYATANDQLPLNDMHHELGTMVECSQLRKLSNVYNFVTSHHATRKRTATELRQ